MDKSRLEHQNSLYDTFQSEYGSDVDEESYQCDIMADDKNTL